MSKCCLSREHGGQCLFSYLIAADSVLLGKTEFVSCQDLSVSTIEGGLGTACSDVDEVKLSVFYYQVGQERSQDGRNNSSKWKTLRREELGLVR